uniref:serine/threonine-protein kinase n=1 Tax=Pseudomonas sp. TaxID=306 RepID=UPI00258AA7C8
MHINIPGYDIHGEIGEGAMATVYLATQRSLDRKVALKVMAAALAADATFCERFLREGRTLARLSHPNTVTIHDIGNVGELYYMAMEFLPSGTLKERLASGMTPEQGLVYLRQIASALGYAHAQGLVHRDVKPANILFRADGTAVLSDFGIAKSLDDRTQFTQAGFAVGTPSYMSPEQARGQEIDGRADLYALGVVLYEMLAGKLPYVGNDALSTALAHLTEPLPELPISQGRYQYILGKLLAKDPAERFADAHALLAALDELPTEVDDATRIRPAVTPTFPGPTPRALEKNNPVAPPSVTVQASAPARKRPIMALSAIAVAVLLALGGGGYALLGGSRTTAAPEPLAQKPAPAPAVVAVGNTEQDGGNRPLLMAGKKTLFQRILSKPGATLATEPGGHGSKPLPAFSVLYVYQRKTVGGGQWLRVGASTGGHSDGWLAADQVSDWKQSLVLKFTERSGRAPVMFLHDATSVERLLADPAAARRALDQADGKLVMALEPGASAIPQDKFYLLPIFDSRESFDENGQPVQLLNVASIDPGTSAQAHAESPAAANTDAFRTAVVLVVDTSVSMQPYIDQVTAVVHTLQQQIAQQGELNNVSFGMVGFRNNVDKTPGLGYLTKTLIPLDQGRDPQRFLELARQVKATSVSSQSFNEDAFAGVMQAVQGMDWAPYGGRLILLVSDAGALRKADPLSSTRMNEAEVRQAALNKQIKIFALHLLTDAGKKNHASAEQQYRVLTTDPNPQIGDLYVPIPGGDVQRFGERVSEIGSVFAHLVHQV